MGISTHFGSKNYALRPDIVQNLCEFCPFFLSNFLAPKCLDTHKLYATNSWSRSIICITITQ